MLPFKRSQEAAASSPPETLERTPEHIGYDPMEEAMQELASALGAKDFAAAADIFRSAFQLMELEPHDEAGHEGMDYGR